MLQRGARLATAGAAPPGSPRPFALSYPGALEDLLELAGLTPIDGGYIQFDDRDDPTTLRGNNSNGPVVLAGRTSGRAAVVNAVRDVLALFRTASAAIASRSTGGT